MTPRPGTYLRNIIEQRAVTQVAVARSVGVSAKHLNQILQGQTLPSAAVTVALAQHLGLDARDLWHMVADCQLDRVFDELSQRAGG